MITKVEDFEITLDTTLPEKTVIPLPDLVPNLGDVPFNFYLGEVKNDDVFIVEFDEPKKMVPSLDKKKADSSFILQYSDAEEDTPATLSMIVEVDLKERVVRAAGYGWTSALVSVEFQTPAAAGAGEETGK